MKIGSPWVHLRLCLTCGHVGCCDSSPNKHASAHWRASEHPIVRSYEPCEEWFWCYPDQLLFWKAYQIPFIFGSPREAMEISAEAYQALPVFQEELDKYKNEDPIIGFKSVLLAEGKLADARFAEMDREAKRLAAESVRFAEESPEPPLEDLYKYTFVEGSNQ